MGGTRGGRHTAQMSLSALVHGCLVLDRNEDCMLLLDPLVVLAAVVAAGLLLGWLFMSRSSTPTPRTAEQPKWVPTHARPVAVVTGGNRGLGKIPMISYWNKL